MCVCIIYIVHLLVVYANVDVCANADIDLVDYSNIDVGIMLKMTGNFVLAAKIFNAFEIF